MTKRIHPKVLESRLKDLLSQQQGDNDSVTSLDLSTSNKTLRLEESLVVDPFETLNNFEVLRIMSGDELRPPKVAGNPNNLVSSGGSNSLLDVGVSGRRDSAFRRVSSSSMSSSDFDESLAPPSGHYSDYSQLTAYQTQLYYCSWEAENQQRLQEEDREQDAMYHSYYE